MSNNKQSSVEWLMDKLFDPSYMQKEQLEWFEQAKVMHKEEIEDAASNHCYPTCGTAYKEAQEYYKVVFGGNNEQAIIDYNVMEEEWEMDNYNEMKDEQR